MTMLFSGTQANVAISGGISMDKHTMVFLYSGEVNNTTVTLGTVPANKVWRVIGAWVNCTMNGVASYATTLLKFNDVSFLACAAPSQAGTSTTVANSWNSNYYDAIVLTAGQTVKVTGNSGSSIAQGGIIYIEEAA